MTGPKVTRNVYCTDPEDRVIECKCACCERCWIFVSAAPKKQWKIGTCPFGGPHLGYYETNENPGSGEPGRG